MKTKIFSTKEIKKAAQMIKKGSLVAFPTETVYGLGANALDSKAVKKIFVAKGRPSDNPLIIHIANKKDLKEIGEINYKNEELVNKLIEKFWPGPLTIILKKTKRIPLEATAGLESVAIRMPDNKNALSLIKHSGLPIAAPSANLSGKPSGTCFEHVFQDFNGKISGIIKGSSCKMGLESSVLDLTAKTPTLLRSGALDLEELKKIIPNIKIYSYKRGKTKSPGMKYRHYSPEAKIILFNKSAHHKIPIYQKKYEAEGKKIKILISEKEKNLAKNLFKIFRQCDKENTNYILISSLEEKGIGLALMNRIKKASFKIVK